MQNTKYISFDQYNLVECSDTLTHRTTVIVYPKQTFRLIAKWTKPRDSDKNWGGAFDHQRLFKAENEEEYRAFTLAGRCTANDPGEENKITGFCSAFGLEHPENK